MTTFVHIFCSTKRRKSLLLSIQARTKNINSKPIPRIQIVIRLNQTPHSPNPAANLEIGRAANGTCRSRRTSACSRRSWLPTMTAWQRAGGSDLPGAERSGGRGRKEVRFMWGGLFFSSSRKVCPRISPPLTSRSPEYRCLAFDVNCVQPRIRIHLFLLLSFYVFLKNAVSG